VLPEIITKPISWLLETKIYKNFARSVLSGLTFRWWGYPKLQGADYWKIREALLKEYEKGDGIFVWCSADDKMASCGLTKLFSKCKYCHSGFIFFDPNHAAQPGELSVKHINTYGYVYEPFENVMNRLDSVYIGRMPIKDLEEARRRLALLDVLCDYPPGENFDYDYALQLEQDLIDLVCDPDAKIPSDLKCRIYCSEFVYLVGHGLVDDPDFKPTWFGEKLIFEPDDVYEGTQKVISL
jgi:hypothetical protein